ncbi:hypothetical protein MKZ38_009252 [Zalerion maritima]|uniref:Uncharacterized protein n=1 Tax=Zalerion maritima TaxID=339359 RepID=A0AAD5RTN5_9PEZI|nr:hypothetical protein MKZ38_009252 [Zalerion maritima]
MASTDEEYVPPGSGRSSRTKPRFSSPVDTPSPSRRRVGRPSGGVLAQTEPALPAPHLPQHLAQLRPRGNQGPEYEEAILPGPELAADIKALVQKRDKLKKEIKNLKDEDDKLHRPEREEEARFEKMVRDAKVANILLKENMHLLERAEEILGGLSGGDQKVQLARQCRMNSGMGMLWNKYDIVMPIIMLHAEVLLLRQMVREAERKLERQAQPGLRGPVMPPIQHLPQQAHHILRQPQLETQLPCPKPDYTTPINPIFNIQSVFNATGVGDQPGQSRRGSSGMGHRAVRGVQNVNIAGMAAIPRIGSENATAIRQVGRETPATSGKYEKRQEKPGGDMAMEGT